MTIYLIRHARQDHTLCNVNISLLEKGRKQASLLGKRLLSYQIDGLYCSDLIRAVETAEIVQKEFDEKGIALSCEIREGIREIDFGALTGHSDEDIKKKFHMFQEKRRKLMGIEDIGFPDGEDGKAVFFRAKKVIEEITLSGKKCVAVITHGGTIRALLAGIFAKDQAMRLFFSLKLENTGITELFYEEDTKHFFLERFNDYSHLEVQEELLSIHEK